MNLTEWKLKLVRVSHYNEDQDWIVKKIKLEWWDDIIKLIKNLKKNPKNKTLTQFMTGVKK